MSIIAGTRFKKRGGAVMVEFAVAIMPLLLACFTFLQIAVMITARMVIRHATVSATRAAIVMSGGGASNPQQGGSAQGNADDIQRAFDIGLGTWGPRGNSLITGTATVTNDPGCSDNCNGPVRVDVTATLRCHVPLGGNVVCGGGSKVFNENYTLPKQGADYQ